MMKIYGLTLTLMTSLIALNCYGYGIGVSTHPLEEKKHFVNGELTTIMQKKTGPSLGLQARYVQRIAEKFTLDGGIGVANGERANRIFAGIDTVIFPDYKYQPRTSVRAYVENANEFNSRHNILGVAPVVSKGLSFWEKVAYPFFAVPMELNLDSSTSKYQTSVRLSLGATAPVGVTDGKPLIGNVEANINVANSYSSVFAGVTYPFN